MAADLLLMKRLASLQVPYQNPSYSLSVQRRTIGLTENRLKQQVRDISLGFRTFKVCSVLKDHRDDMLPNLVIENLKE